MIRRSLLVSLLGFLGVVHPSAHAQSKSSLRTSDIALTFEAAENAPRITTLSNGTGSAWQNKVAEVLPGSVEIAGKTAQLHWAFNSSASKIDSHRVALVYDCATPKLRLTWEWRAAADFGPIEHTIRVENQDSQELWLPFLDSFRFDWQTDPAVPLRHIYIEKGADSPSAEGTHTAEVLPDYHWEGRSSTYAHPGSGEAREIIPWTFVEKKDSQGSAWYVGIEFSGRTRIELTRSGSSLSGGAGLNPNPGPFRTRIAPGSSFETPTVFLGGSHDGVDAAGNQLRRWIRQVLGNPAAWQNPNYPALVNNSWGSGMAVDEALAQRMLRDSAELQFEMFHIDAGWFRGVGDWYPDPVKFPHGLAAIADEAHRLGLKFGLWVDWTQAALDSNPGALNVRDPKVNSWVVADTPADWKPEAFKGQTIDLGVPEAQAWAQREVDRIVTDYHLDMLEHDGYLVAQGCSRSNHPHAPPDPSNTRIQTLGSSFCVESSNSTDVSYHAVRAYYDIYSALRKNHPGLLLEVCNDGGRMVDFGSAAHADYFSITDTYDPLSNRRAFYDASHVLPPAMLEAYVEKWPVPHIENFRYMLRSGMMGWLTIMLDTTAWSPEQHEVARSEFTLYKSVLRPLIRDAALYHISARPDGIHWDGMEYFDPVRKTGAVFAFRGSLEKQNSHTFPLKGVRSERYYQLQFQDHSSPNKKVTGRELLETGLTVSLPVPNSSELIFLTEVPR